MKKLIALAIIGIAWTAGALDKAQIELRTQKLLQKLEAMQQKPDKKIPAQVLSKAEGIILLDRTKAGFVFAYQGGNGMAMVKDKKSGKWGPLAFLKANEGSLGFQIGGQQAFYVILLMNTESTKSLMADDGTFEFGGEARGTAGDTSAGAEGTVSSVDRAVMVYDDRHGLFGGAAIKGGAISPDDEANLIYYGAPVTVKDILFDKKVKPSEAAAALAKKIAEFSRS